MASRNAINSWPVALYRKLYFFGETLFYVLNNRASYGGKYALIYDKTTH